MDLLAEVARRLRQRCRLVHRFRTDPGLRSRRSRRRRKTAGQQAAERQIRRQTGFLNTPVRSSPRLADIRIEAAAPQPSGKAAKAAPPIRRPSPPMPSASRDSGARIRNSQNVVSELLKNLRENSTQLPLHRQGCQRCRTIDLSDEQILDITVDRQTRRSRPALRNHPAPGPRGRHQVTSFNHSPYLKYELDQG